MGKREENKIRRNQLVLDAATSLFSSRGFDGTRIEDVAEIAGVSVGTIYLRYKTKSDLLKGVLESFEQRFVDAMNDENIHQAPYPARFANVFGAIMKTAGESPELPAIMQLAFYAQIEGWVPGESVREAIAEQMHKSQQSGELRNDVPPAHVAAITHGMVEGIMRHMMIHNIQDPTPFIHSLTEAASRWLIEQ